MEAKSIKLIKNTYKDSQPDRILETDLVLSVYIDYLFAEDLNGESIIIRDDTGSIGFNT